MVGVSGDTAVMDCRSTSLMVDTVVQVEPHRAGRVRHDGRADGRGRPGPEAPFLSWQRVEGVHEKEGAQDLAIPEGGVVRPHGDDVPNRAVGVEGVPFCIALRR